jgi:hypothetical protein
MRLWPGLGIVLLCFLASPVLAGAWQREKGRWFMSTSASFTTGEYGYLGYYGAYYAEYGLTDRLTLGVDAGVSETGATTVLFFTRRPLWQGKNGGRLALEIASGTSGGMPVIRPGLSWGRGLQTKFGPGWFAIDATMPTNMTTGLATYKVDTTVGVTLSDRWKAILQFQADLSPGLSQSVKVAPSVVIRVNKLFQFELGVSQSLIGSRQTGLKLGIWVDF